jgi:hypothetical protein
MNREIQMNYPRFCSTAFNTRIKLCERLVGQLHCVYLFTRIQRNHRSLNEFLEIFKRINVNQKLEKDLKVIGPMWPWVGWPTGLRGLLRPQPSPAVFWPTFPSSKAQSDRPVLGYLGPGCSMERGR